MIRLNYQRPIDPDDILSQEVYTEGLIKDSIKDAKDAIDDYRDDVKDAWDKADNTVTDKAKVVDDKVLSKASDTVSKVNDVMDKHRLKSKSIVARSKNSILYFPVYITPTNSVKLAQVIADTFERVYVSLVQASVGQNPEIDEDEVNDLKWLKQFHVNLNESMDRIITDYNEYYESVDEIDQSIHDSFLFSTPLTENCTVIFSRCNPNINQDLILEHKRLIEEPLTGFRFLQESDDDDAHGHITGEEKTNQTKLEKLSDEEFRNMAINELNISTKGQEYLGKSNGDISRMISDEFRSSEPVDHSSAAHARWANNKKLAIKSAIDHRDDIEDKVKDKIDDIKDKIKNGKYPKQYQYDHGTYYRAYNSNGQTKIIRSTKREAEPVTRAVDAPTLLRDSDIKKTNSLLPYTMVVTFRIRATKDRVARDVHYVIGVKTVLHLIQVKDLAEDLRDIVTGNIKSLQKVRYKSGEISAMDYFFDLKHLKKDAAKRLNPGKRWLDNLKRLGEYEKMNGSLLKKPVDLITNGKAPIPNGTMVLSQPDVVTLTNETGIDLNQVSNALKLSKRLFLMAFVIVDGSAGSMKVLFHERSSEWEIVSLASIESELSKQDNSKIMSEISKLVNR